jgi:hypothetical protein
LLRARHKGECGLAPGCGCSLSYCRRAAHAALAQIPNLYKKPLYNPLMDFEHVVMHSDSARIGSGCLI